MIFRSVKAHIEKENWFDVGVDFFIVVVGVFVGLQVENWNDAQTLDNRETELLYELKKEMENSIITTNQKIDSYAQVAAAGKRSLDFLSSNVSCETECWAILVDFMHASQWQALSVKRSSYENMRRIGLPRKSAVVDAVEANHAQVDAATAVFSSLPYYREIVRQLISNEAQLFYWNNYYSLIAGVESYDLNCANGVTEDSALETVEAIVQHPEIKPHLTKWYGAAALLAISLDVQNTLAETAIEVIEAELERR